MTDDPGEHHARTGLAGARHRFTHPTLDLVRHAAYASLAVNILLVVTGGLVRLTSSGLGCPTWPRCTETSLTATPAMGIHGAIEFGNRMLSGIVGFVALVSFLVAWFYKPVRKDLRLLGGLVLAGVPAQAIIGGITVRTQLNPWVVSLHMIASMLMITGTVALARRARTSPYPHTPRVVRDLAIVMVVFAWITIVLGTMVTGAGPHAGDASSKRNGIDGEQIAQLHADAVFALFGITLALLVASRVTPSSLTLRRLVSWLFAVQLLQGAVGFIQYFTGVPLALVLAHMFLAAVMMALVTATYGERGTELGA